MYKEISLETFASEVASLEPVPGGGSVSALAGALAAALAVMVALLTLKKERYADRESEMLQLRDEAEQLQQQLLAAVDQDAQSYRQVLAAFRLRKSTEKEKQKRAEALQAAFRKATEVPLEVAETALKVLELTGNAARRGNPDMVTDAGVGILLARAAALGALMNAEFNLGSLKDRQLAAEMKTRIGRMKQTVHQMEKQYLDSISLAANAGA